MNSLFKSKAVLIFIAFALFFTSTTIASAEEDAIKIVCTNQTLADFTSNIIRENVSINYIMPGGACPSHFDTKPSDIETCINADVIVSLGFEPWLEGLINSSGNTNIKEIKCTGLGEWSLPSNAINFVEKIADELSLFYPEFVDAIQQNADNYILEINQTATLMQELVKTYNFEGRKVISMIWQKDFVEFLGFEVVSFYAPPESLSTQDQLNISDAATSGDVCVIIDNLQSGTEFGETIAEQAEISHVVFTNFPGAIDDVDSYLEVIEYNTGEILKGVTIFDYKQENMQDSEDSSSNVELQRNTAVVVAIIAIILAFVLFVMYKKK